MSIDENIQFTDNPTPPRSAEELKKLISPLKDILEKQRELEEKQGYLIVGEVFWNRLIKDVNYDVPSWDTLVALRCWNNIFPSNLLSDECYRIPIPNNLWDLT